MSLFAFALAAAPAAALQDPVLHEIAVLETGLAPTGLSFVNALALEGAWLAAGGADLGGFEGQMLFRREGDAWTLIPVPASGGFVDLDGQRYATSAAENHYTTVLQRSGAGWELEATFPEDYSTLHGKRLLTHSFQGRGTDFRVNAWRRERTGWELDAVLVPPAPQEFATCCFPLELWGNTAAFRARGSSGDEAVHVFVRRDGRWHLEAELVPAEFLGTGRGDLGVLQVHGHTIVALYFDGTASLAFVWERESGAWHERARLAPPGPIWSLAYEEDTLVLGLGPPQGVALVYERSQGRWHFSAQLAASSGQEIGRAVAIEERLVVCSTTDYFPPSASRLFVFKRPPFPRLTTYGCGVNPSGSLRVVSGSPTAGASVRLALDNPLGTQAAGSLAFLGSSARPDPHHPCGTLVPRAGMDRGPGEFLLRPDALVRVLGAWLGPGQPVETEIAIPRDLALVGRRLYLQGALQDSTAGARVPLGLTGALELEVGLSEP